MAAPMQSEGNAMCCAAVLISLTIGCPRDAAGKAATMAVPPAAWHRNDRAIS